MSDISEQAKLKACELADADPTVDLCLGAIKAACERGYMHAFAAFVQQVSDACKGVALAVPFMRGDPVLEKLAPFILPDPVDPLTAPLVDALKCAVDFRCDAPLADSFREQLAKRGLKIVQSDEA